MHVKQVLNNSVVLGIDSSGVEVILLGPGLGFRTSPGDPIDPAVVQRTFVPEGISSLERLAALVEEISIEAVAVAEELVRAGRERLGPYVTYRMLLPLADHVGMAIKRAEKGQIFDYPLRSELSYLYPRELAFAHEALDIVERRAGVRFPDGEVVPIAMHFVNAQFGSEDMRDYVKMTDALQRILVIIEDEYRTQLDKNSVHVARFVTHLRFLFVRAHKRSAGPGAVDAGQDAVLEAVRTSRPRQYASAVRIGSLLEESFGWDVDREELLYLSLHVARLTSDLATPTD